MFVKDVDLESMPTSIFLNDDDDGDDGLQFGLDGQSALGYDWSYAPRIWWPSFTKALFPRIILCMKTVHYINKIHK